MKFWEHRTMVKGVETYLVLCVSIILFWYFQNISFFKSTVKLLIKAGFLFLFIFKAHRL